MTDTGHDLALATTTAVYRPEPDLDAELQALTSSAAAASALGSGTLVLTRGELRRTRFLLSQKTLSAGRHPDSEIFLDDVTVSRHHAQLRWLDDEYWIVDVGSLNGTYVNGVRVTSMPLNDGDQIELGKFAFTFTCPPVL